MCVSPVPAASQEPHDLSSCLVLFLRQERPPDGHKISICCLQSIINVYWEESICFWIPLDNQQTWRWVSHRAGLPPPTVGIRGRTVSFGSVNGLLTVWQTRPGTGLSPAERYTFSHETKINSKTGTTEQLFLRFISPQITGKVWTHLHTFSWRRV